MADLATFSHGLVHDLRNPLNVIRSNLYLLRQRLSEEDARALRAVDRIDDQVTASLRILEGLQAFYRSDQPSLQRVQLSELVRTVVGTIQPPEGCGIETELADDLPLITADPQLLDSALRAMIRNALDVMPGEGTVRVSTCRNGTSQRVVVEDQGPGIPPEVLPHVFEPLFTTRKSRSGLGLALVQRVAQAHGGHALVTSEPGQGTQAILELPGD